MSRPSLCRAALLVLVAYCLILGLVAVVTPHTFFADFPFLAHWVERLPPYNEHLVTDVGGLYLGFAVVLLFAAWRPERTLVLAACCGFLVFAVPHLIYHALNLQNFGAIDGAAELAALASLTVPPTLAIWASSPTAGGAQ